MPDPRRRKILYGSLIFVLLLAVSAGGYLLWLSRHYQRMLAEQVPIALAKATDSLYHITFKDIRVSVFDHSISVTDIRLTPDLKQAAAIRARHHKIPPTLSTVSISLLEGYGLAWGDILSTGAIDCKNIVVHDLKWKLVCAPHPGDSLFAGGKKDNPLLKRIAAEQVRVIKPDITYRYEGAKDSFSFFFKGGEATLRDWAYNTDQRRDTSVLLYAHGGDLRIEELIFLKNNGRYIVKKPYFGFESSPNSVTIKALYLRNMINTDPRSGLEKETYNIMLPYIKMSGFNWNKLITDNVLRVTSIDAEKPEVYERYFDKNEVKTLRRGAYPHQLLLQAGTRINLETVNLSKGRVRYTEVTTKDQEAVIEFGDVHGRFTNITNTMHGIARNKECTAKLTGMFMDKSEVQANFHFFLGDTSGRFRLNGTLKNMDGDEVLKQVQAFTFAEVTSFHLDEMDMDIQGDESYTQGDFTVLYKDLKLSLFKFKSKARMGKKGPLSFLGSTLLLYPSNPMKDDPPRQVHTSFARDAEKGFISMLWKNIYRAAKKTAVRHERLIILTDGQETKRGDDPKKKPFLDRLFGKKHP